MSNAANPSWNWTLNYAVAGSNSSWNWTVNHAEVGQL